MKLTSENIKASILVIYALATGFAIYLNHSFTQDVLAHNSNDNHDNEQCEDDNKHDNMHDNKDDNHHDNDDEDCDDNHHNNDDDDDNNHHYSPSPSVRASVNPSVSPSPSASCNGICIIIDCNGGGTCEVNTSPSPSASASPIASNTPTPSATLSPANPPQGGSSDGGSSVGGASASQGDVLGATTLASTGTFTETARQLMLSVGALFLGASKLTHAQKKTSKSKK